MAVYSLWNCGLGMECSSVMNSNAAISMLRDKWGRKDGLCLVLGAGVSAASGLPTWFDLIAMLHFRRLNKSIWDQYMPYSNYLRAVSEHFLRANNDLPEIAAEKIIGSLSPDDFLGEIHQCLYLGIKDEPSYKNAIERNQLANAIAALCERRTRIDEHGCPSMSSAIRAILTYNYDDIVERQLSLGGIPTEVITGKSKPGWNEEHLPVHHVHGYVPFIFDGNEGEVILTESSYNEMALRQTSWQQIVHTTCLAGSTCLLLGLSLNDLSLRRHLYSIAHSPLKGEHVVILRRTKPAEVNTENYARIDRRASDLMDMSGSGKKDPDGRKLIDQWLREAQRQDEEDQADLLRSIGVNVIWVDDYSQIPQLLHRICA